MSLPDPTQLTDAVRRGRLTTDEMAELRRFLAAHPEEQAAWEEDLSLNTLLRQIPDVSLSSNFTAQVLQAVHREVSTGSRPLSGAWSSLWTRHWWPKLAVSLSVLVLSVVSYQRHHELVARRESARNLATISIQSGDATLELLQNFDAIQRLGQIPRDTDKGLIAALQ
jgi:anti-sigma factor RsiW